MVTIDKETKLKKIKCPLCGYKFNEEEVEQVCNFCPKFMSCSLVMCPNCCHEFPAPK